MSLTSFQRKGRKFWNWFFDKVHFVFFGSRTTPLLEGHLAYPQGIGVQTNSHYLLYLNWIKLQHLALTKECWMTLLPNRPMNGNCYTCNDSRSLGGFLLFHPVT